MLPNAAEDDIAAGRHSLRGVGGGRWYDLGHQGRKAKEL